MTFIIKYNYFVSAINPTTLQVTGKDLKALKVENLTIDGNKVVAVSSTDGTTATVTLDAKLAPNKEVVLKVKEGDTTKEFKTTFEYKVTSVTIDTLTFDDDRAGQVVTFKVNGETAVADIDYLKLAGYTVNLVATNVNTGAAENIFVGPANTSSTGALVTGITKGEYNVEVQLIKSGNALVSTKAKISVVNLDADTTSIESIKFANQGAATDNTTYNTKITTGDDFLMNSTTLVAGEKAEVFKIEATIAGVKTVVPSTGFEVKSSDPAVVSVLKSAGEYILTAESRGTANITVTVGGVTKTVTFTVTNDVRNLTTVTTNPTSLKVINTKSTSLTVKTLDQYGDPFAVATGDALVDEVVPTNAGGTAIATGVEVVTDANSASASLGTGSITLTGNAVGKGTVYFKNAVTQTTLGTVYVDVTGVNNVGSKKLEIISAAPNSTDNALELYGDNLVSYELSNYNTEGVYAGSEVLGTASSEYTIEVADPTVAKLTTATVTTPAAKIGPAGPGVSTIGATDAYFNIVAQKAGSTDVILKDKAGAVVGKVTVTVSDAKFKLTGVNFKSVPTINYAGKVINAYDVLDITSSNADDIVNGLTLSKSTQSKIRIAEANGGGAVTDLYLGSKTIAKDELYLDLDNNGTYTSGDAILGKLVASATSDSTFTTSTFTATNLLDTTNGLLSSKTISGSKGTILIKVQVDADADGYEDIESIAGTTVVVDVK